MLSLKHFISIAFGLMALMFLPSLRLAQSATTTYIHGQGLQPLVMLDGVGTPTLYIPGPNGQPLAQVVLNASGAVSQTTWLLRDHLGSTRLALTNSGQVQARFDYAPFGATTAVDVAGAGAQPVLFRYTGQEVNGELGTYHYHARQYDPLTGRFLSVDPARQFASPYVYVGNNPTNATDPDGRQCVFCGSTTCTGSCVNPDQADSSATLPLDQELASLLSDLDDLMLTRPEADPTWAGFDAPTTQQIQVPSAIQKAIARQVADPYAVVLIDLPDHLNPEQVDIVTKAVGDKAPVFAIHPKDNPLKLPVQLHEFKDYIIPIEKHYKFNGFAGSRLPGELEARGIHNIVLSGYQANCCAMRTAVGGIEGRPPTAMFQPGAANEGYKVYTDKPLLNFVFPGEQPKPAWNHPNVIFLGER